MAQLIVALLLSPLQAAKPGLPPPAVVFQELFGVAVPKGVKVLQFHHDGPGMDPSFAWEFSPVDRAFVKRLLTVTKWKRAPAPVESSDRWPAKWPYAKVNALAEAYSREFQDGGHRHFWIDPKSNRMFAEFLGM